MPFDLIVRLFFLFSRRGYARSYYLSSFSLFFSTSGRTDTHAMRFPSDFNKTTDWPIHPGQIEHLARLRRWLLRLGKRTHQRRRAVERGGSLRGSTVAFSRWEWTHGGVRLVDLRRRGHSTSRFDERYAVTKSRTQRAFTNSTFSRGEWCRSGRFGYGREHRFTLGGDARARGNRKLFVAKRRQQEHEERARQVTHRYVPSGME